MEMEMEREREQARKGGGLYCSSFNPNTGIM